MKSNTKTIYYKDELNDEFSGVELNTKKVDGSYVYIRKGVFRKFTHYFWYRIIATPVAFIYLKFAFHHKIVNKKLLKVGKKQSYFLFGNHTQPVADAFIPSMLCFPKHIYAIVHANNISIPYLGKITPSLGALPLPDDLEATKNFVKAIEYRVKEGKPINIYPEAHIWPYYTKIRPFSDASFRYPVKYDLPSFCFTNTYQKRKHSKKPRIVTYIDGPFYVNKSLPASEQKQDLRNRVYEAMVARSKESNIECVKYIKESSND